VQHHGTRWHRLLCEVGDARARNTVTVFFDALVSGCIGNPHKTQRFGQNYKTMMDVGQMIE
jgi:hypothetical protein